MARAITIKSHLTGHPTDLEQLDQRIANDIGIKGEIIGPIADAMGPGSLTPDMLDHAVRHAFGHLAPEIRGCIISTLRAHLCDENEVTVS